jgi:hypothetical protein
LSVWENQTIKAASILQLIIKKQTKLKHNQMPAFVLKNTIEFKNLEKKEELYAAHARMLAH